MGAPPIQHKLLDGNFNAAVNVTANTADQNGEDTAGLFDQRELLQPDSRDGM